MEIEELLVAIGIDTSQAAKIQEVVVALGAAAVAMANEANKINGDLDTIGESATQGAEEAGKKAEEAGRSMSKLKMIAVGVGAVIGFVSGKVLGFLDSAIAGAQNLSKEKGLLFDISKQELQQADEYQEAMKKTGLSIESIKTKIALNLVPQLTAITQKFNDWLGANKELIAAGLTKVIQWAGRFFRVIINTGRAIWKVIDSTIGWRGALILLAAAFAILNRSMLMSPITWVIAAIVGLMLVIDDLMGYLDGKESLFGEFWGACIGWIKSVITWWNELSEEWQTTIKLIGAMLAAAFGSNLFLTVTKGAGGFAKVLGFILSPLRRLTSMAMSAGKAFIWLGRALMMNPIGIIIGLVVGLVYVLHDLYKWLTTGDSVFGNFWQTISDTWSNIKKAFQDGVKNILMWLGMSEDGADKTVAGISAVFGTIFDVITTPFRLAWDLIKGLFKIWGDDTKSLTEKLGDTFWLVVDLIKKPFEEAFDWVLKKIEWIRGKVSWLFGSIGDGVEKLNDEVKKNPEIYSATGGIRTANFGAIPMPPQAKGGNTTYITVEGAKIDQNIVTNDPAKAGKVAAAGINQAIDLKRTMNNTGTVFANGN
ncbi:TPA: hypothetical protein ACWLTD_003274 [Morganella morganii]|uniref:hypothetical protein n=1 Tax=Morganella morganii TaxID=582 RepID=UPI000F837B18|nr:hypothetical protein [Morganella morganii]RTY32465.1 hypothetical protein EKS33_08175 [Morganella morganii subsp. morganii]HEI8864200.1 hypothetical protein [Morganella morganii]